MNTPEKSLPEPGTSPDVPISCQRQSWCHLPQAADGNQAFDVYIKHYLNAEEYQRKDYHLKTGAPLYVPAS